MKLTIKKFESYFLIKNNDIGKTILFMNIIIKTTGRGFRSNIIYQTYICYFIKLINNHKIENIFNP